MNKLLQNSIESIQIGIEDYFSNDPKRILSCVRNLFSGILLLFKAKLLDICPLDSDEVLIKKDIVPVLENGKIIFKGKGETTIDVKEIQERFKSLNIKTDWNIIKKIQKERNNIEHYCVSSSIDSLKSLIVSTFTIVNDFIRNELSLKPNVLLGDDTWKKLIQIREVYLEEKMECDEKINSMFTLEENQIQVIKNMYCENCGSELLIPKAVSNNINSAILECTVCKETFKVMDIFEKVVENIFDPDSFENAKMGFSNIEECPQCGKNTFDERENKCYFCDFEKDYTKCKRCGAELSLEEQDCDGFCSYCYDQFQKIMEDD